MSKSWDNGILRRLKTLLGRGLSTSEIGKKLGLSKNAVVGKIHRLGWSVQVNDADTRAKRGAKKAAAKKETKCATKATKTPAKKKISVTAKPKKVTVRSAKESAVHQRMVQHALEMANLKPDQCRWPIGDPDSEGFHFCGAPVFVGKPYCYEHCKQAYQFTTPPKKK